MFYYSHPFNTRENLFCQMGSMEPTTNFQIQILNPLFYIPFIFNTLFFKNTTEFLNLTTAPMQQPKPHWDDNPLCSFISSSLFFIPTDPQAPFHSLLTVTTILISTLHSQSLLIVPISLAHIPVPETALTASIFYF